MDPAAVQVRAEGYLDKGGRSFRSNRCISFSSDSVDEIILMESMLHVREIEE